MSIFKKLLKLFYQPILPPTVYDVKPFTLVVLDRRELAYKEERIGSYLKGIANMTDRIIYVEYDETGKMPDEQTLGHEIKHLLYGSFHK